MVERGGSFNVIELPADQSRCSFLAKCRIRCPRRSAWSRTLSAGRSLRLYVACRPLACITSHRSALYRTASQHIGSLFSVLPTAFHPLSNRPLPLRTTLVAPSSPSPLYQILWYDRSTPANPPPGNPRPSPHPPPIFPLPLRRRPHLPHPGRSGQSESAEDVLVVEGREEAREGR
jgi:hypothetical protein